MMNTLFRFLFLSPPSLPHPPFTLSSSRSSLFFSSSCSSLIFSSSPSLLTLQNQQFSFIYDFPQVESTFDSLEDVRRISSLRMNVDDVIEVVDGDVQKRLVEGGHGGVVELVLKGYLERD